MENGGEMTKLKACPFCGEEPAIRNDDGVTMVLCNNFDCQNSDNEEMSIAGWNTRPLEDALQKRIEGLEILSSAGNLASDCAMEYRDELGKLRQSLKKAIKEIMDKFGDEISISDVGDKTAMSNVTKKGVGLELALVVLKKHGLIESEEK